MRPNILLILADQRAAKNIGCYGCSVPDIRPNIDILAARDFRGLMLQHS